MKKILAGLAVATAALGAFLLGSAHARAPQSRPIVVCGVPAEWGKFQGGALGGLIFEDASGTLRVVDCRSHQPIVAYEIPRR